MRGQAALDRAANQGMSPVLLKGRMGQHRPRERLQILCSSLMRVKRNLNRESTAKRIRGDAQMALALEQRVTELVERMLERDHAGGPSCLRSQGDAGSIDMATVPAYCPVGSSAQVARYHDSSPGQILRG